MDGAPEGTPGGSSRRVSRWWLVLGAVFVGYLAFRVAQGVLWLVHQF